MSYSTYFGAADADVDDRLLYNVQSLWCCGTVNR
jgi:hypothetical protein